MQGASRRLSVPGPKSIWQYIRFRWDELRIVGAKNADARPTVKNAAKLLSSVGEQSYSPDPRDAEIRLSPVVWNPSSEQRYFFRFATYHPALDWFFKGKFMHT